MENTQKYEALIGTLIDERYRVLDIRGAGGMAVVLKAEDTHMNRSVALKILSDEFSSDEEAVRRFVNESKAVALLDHEHIVAIYDVAFDGKYKYIVMEYLDGLTLKEYMMKKGRLPVDEALDFTEQILTALEHAHNKGVIHRDIKPQNIIILPGGVLKVADFGIAKTPDSKTISHSDKAMGTVHYISPEQAAGNPTGFYSDLYSVGVMLYEMVTGRLPFEAETPLAIAMMQINNQPTPPRKIDPSISKGLEQIILKTMSKNPADRFKSARSMLRAIQIIKEKPNAVFEDRPKAVKSIGKEKEAPEERKGFFARLFSRDDDPNVRYKSGRRTLFPVIMGVFLAFFLVAAIVLGIFMISFFNGSLSSFGISQKVPDVVGKTYNDTLTAELFANNYRITAVDYLYDETYEPNTIVRQSPEANTVKKTTGAGGKIDLSLVVSLGPESVPIPDVSTFDYREAQIMLQERGLIVQTAEEFSDVISEGYVIGTSPAAGAHAAAGDTLILYVSKGQNIVYGKIPNVVGLSLEGAKALIHENSFMIGDIIREPSSEETDTVLSQSIAPGTDAAKEHTKINLVISIKQ